LSTPMEYKKEILLTPPDVPGGAGEYVLAGDIGGTNTRLALFLVDGDDYRPVFILSFDTQKVSDFPRVVLQAIDFARRNYGVAVSRAVVSGAGPVMGGVCKLTNASWIIDSAAVMRATGLARFDIINDFAAIGYGLEPLERLRPESIVSIKPGDLRPGTVKAVIGAGTGLGKGFLVYDKQKSRFAPFPSEGGHEIFGPTDEEEFKLMLFAKESLKVEQVIYEHLVTGSGIALIYRFLKGEPDLEIDPGEVTGSVERDPLARKAFDIFTRLYARTAKNSALNLLPYSGVYLAGGIIARTVDIMDRGVFAREFTTHPKHSKLLIGFPVFAVLDYDVSLFGLVNYLVNFADG